MLHISNAPLHISLSAHPDLQDLRNQMIPDQLREQPKSSPPLRETRLHLSSSSLLFHILPSSSSSSGSSRRWVGRRMCEWDFWDTFGCRICSRAKWRHLRLMLRSVGYHSNQHVTRLTHNEKFYLQSDRLEISRPATCPTL